MTTAKESYQILSEQNSGYFEVQLSVISETDKAICFNNSGAWLSSQTRGVWMPKSQMQIVDGSAEGFDKRYFVKNWLYSKLK